MNPLRFAFASIRRVPRCSAPRMARVAPCICTGNMDDRIFLS